MGYFGAAEAGYVGLLVADAAGSAGGHHKRHTGRGGEGTGLNFCLRGFNESNRFWTITRPFQLQFDPFLETLLDLDPKTGEFIPRLADKWQPSPDQHEWTFMLRKGVPFHFGLGEFTAKDVVHTHALMLRQDAIATFAGFWRGVDEVKVIDDHQVIFRMKNPSSTLPYAVSRSGDLRMVRRPNGTRKGSRDSTRDPLALARTAMSHANWGSPSAMNGWTTIGAVHNRRSKNWKSVSPARIRHDWPCC